MSDVLIITLTENKPCARPGCKIGIKPGEVAIRKPVKETKHTTAKVLYYHRGCWNGK